MHRSTPALIWKNRKDDDLRILNEASAQYVLEYGEWPGDGTAAATPDYTLANGNTGTPFAADAMWTKKNTLGGQWDFEGTASGVLSGLVRILSVSHTATDSTPLKLDAIMDDGNLFHRKFPEERC